MSTIRRERRRFVLRFRSLIKFDNLDDQLDKIFLSGNRLGRGQVTRKFLLEKEKGNVRNSTKEANQG